MITSKGFRIIAVVVIFSVIAVLLIQRFGPFAEQRKNMAAAEQHISLLRPIFASDQRFTNIVASMNTAEDGCLFIRGELPAEKDLEDLKQRINNTRPPVKVFYRIDFTTGG